MTSIFAGASADAPAASFRFSLRLGFLRFRRMRGVQLEQTMATVLCCSARCTYSVSAKLIPSILGKRSSCATESAALIGSASSTAQAVVQMRPPHAMRRSPEC